jgi:predicted nucleic acid-binding protein
VILPDVNVLFYAFRKDSAHHDVCKPWLEKVAGDDAPFGISPLALSAVARIVTNPRVFREPSPIANSFGLARDIGRFSREFVSRRACGDRAFLTLGSPRSP